LPWATGRMEAVAPSGKAGTYMGGLFGSEGEALTRGRSSVPRWGVATFSEWG